MPIDDLIVWTYRDQKADRVIARGAGLHHAERLADGLEPHEHSACGCYAVGQIAALGARIDRSAPDPGALNPTAEAVHMTVVAELSAAERFLIMYHGRTAGRPEWGQFARFRFEPAWREFPVYDDEGRPKPGAYKTISKNKRVVACLVEPKDTPQEIELERENYRLWIRALDHLFAVFSETGLPGAVVRPPRAPREPWVSSRRTGPIAIRATANFA